ncbi:uncharacterized protein LOC143346096 [Colletes latitarsis]|uniref:uncharacterized protein LOC143346096 n=1 Tax=Colletes latitarsis TaxID=2605962 RepID=UPI004034F9C1
MFENFARIAPFGERRTWRLLRATDFESLMCFNFCMNLVFGLFPYKYESSKYVFSRIRFVYSTLILLIFIAVLSVTIYQVNFGSLMYYNTPGTLLANFSLFLGGFDVVVMYILTRLTLCLLQNISRMSQILSPKDFNDLAKLFHTKDIFGLLFLAVHLPNCFKENVYLTVRHLTFLYLVTVSFLLDMYYMNCVCVLKACFRKVNENLEELNKPWTKDELQSNTSMTDEAPRDEQGNTLLLMKVKNLEKKHLCISDVVQLLNKTFLVHIVILTVTTFTVITFNLYFFLLRLNENFIVDLTTQFSYVQFLPSAFYAMIKFMMLIWACETAKNQAREIGATIHDVFSNATDRLVKYELELFSLQVLQRDNTFSARVVTMNAALLTQVTLL